MSLCRFSQHKAKEFLWSIKGGHLWNQSSPLRPKNTTKQKQKNKVAVRMPHQDCLSILIHLLWLFWNFCVGCAGRIDRASLLLSCRPAGMWRTPLHPRNLLDSPFLVSISRRDVERGSSPKRCPLGLLRDSGSHSRLTSDLWGGERAGSDSTPFLGWYLWSVPEREVADWLLLSSGLQHDAMETTSY